MGPGHSHGAEDLPDDLAPQRIRRGLTIAAAAIAMLTVVGILVLRPGGDLPPLGEEFGFTEERYDATITEVDVTNCNNTAPADAILCEEIRFDVTSGERAGDTGSFQQPIEPLTPEFSEGEGIVVGFQADLPDFLQYRFTDYQRGRPLLVLAALFCVAVLALGRIQGFRALIGLGVSGAVLLAFVLPAILDGKNPLAVALVGSSAIAFAALYLTHGFNERTTVALLGSFASLALTGVLGLIFIGVARITGLASENAVLLQAAGGQVDLEGLVLAGIVIGTLGVLDDVTVTQVSAVWQLYLANPTRGFGELAGAAIAIGRDHIASTVNTLVLAYAGAALPLLLIFSQADRPLSEWLTTELIGTEVVRTLVGSIGLVASVPITTFLAAAVVTAPARSGRTDRTGPPGAVSPLPVGPPDQPPVADGEPAPSTWDDFAPEDRTDLI